MSKTIERFDCEDCGSDTSNKGLKEFYVVNNVTWRIEAGFPSGMLCIGCLEARIGRELHCMDFPIIPANLDILMGTHTCSDRLYDRVTRQFNNTNGTYKANSLLRSYKKRLST